MNDTSLDPQNIDNNTVIQTDSTSPTTILILRAALIIYMVLGIVGNIFNMLIFTRRAVIHASVSLYLFSTSVANLLVVTLVLPFRLFADGFNLDLTATSTEICRVVSFFYFVFLTLPPIFTVLACADRWAASCVQVNRRRLASLHIAKRAIPASVIICCLLYSHIFVTFINDPRPPPPDCSVSDSYAIFVLTYHLIIYSLIPSSLMALFSIKIIVNVRRKRNHIMPVNHALNSSVNGGVPRRRLSQMQVMLVCQAIIECCLTLPYSIVNLVALVVVNDGHFLDIYSLLRLPIFFNSVSSFYIYTLSSKLYRNELKELFKFLRNFQ